MKNPDKQSIQNFCNDFDSFISGMADPAFKSRRVQIAYLLFIQGIKTAIYKFSKIIVDEKEIV